MIDDSKTDQLRIDKVPFAGHIVSLIVEEATGGWSIDRGAIERFHK
jgi:hypothetical protein